jgi:HlyD family secretion protein
VGVATRMWVRRGARPPIHAPRAERRITPGLLLVLLLGLVIGATGAYAITLRAQANRASLAAAPPQIPGLPVAVKRGPIVVTLPAAGAAVPERQAKLGPRVPGTLTEVNVKPGDTVRTGDILARVDATKLQSKLTDAQSQQREAKSKLDQMKGGPRPEEVTQAEASVQGAQAKLADAVTGPPAPDLAAAQAQANAAAATLRSAQARVNTLTGGKAPPELQDATREATKAAADLQRAEGQLGRVKTGPSLDEVKAQDVAVQEAKRVLTRELSGRNLACIKAGGLCEAAKAAFLTAQATLSQAEAKLQALKTPATATEIDAATQQVETARQAATQANSKVSRLQSGNVGTPADLRQAEAAVEQATADHEAAQAKVEATRQGPKAGEVQSAQSQLVGAQAQLALKRQPNTAQDLAQAEERVNRADIAVQDAQRDLDGATMVAPFDGIVTSVTGVVGDQAGPGAVLTVIDPRGLRVEVGLDEVNVRQVAVGAPARVTFVPAPDRQYPAKVIAIAGEPTTQNNLSRYAVTLGLDDQSSVSRPGTSADASILVAQKDNVLLVPVRAVGKVGEERAIVVLANGKPEVRQITTGLRNDQVVEVSGTIREGEEVLVPAPTLLLNQARLKGLGAPGGLAIPTVLAVPTAPSELKLPGGVTLPIP